MKSSIGLVGYAGLVLLSGWLGFHLLSHGGSVEAEVRAGGSNVPERKPFVNSLGMRMLPVPAGSFEMGSDDLEWCWCQNCECEQPIHTVNIGYDFYIGKYEITQAQWHAVMSSDPPDLAFPGKPENPVERVSWNDIRNAGGFLEKKLALWERRLL